MAEHAHSGRAHVGRPVGDSASGVPQSDDCVPGIVAHHIAGAHACSVLRYDLASAGVLQRISMGCNCWKRLEELIGCCEGRQVLS